nr:hypothetical protein [Micromonospora sp. 4G55]
MHRLEEDRGVVQVGDRGDHHVGGGRPQPQRHRLVAGHDGLQALALHAQQPLVDLLEQVVLGGEVVVHRALGDPGGLDDLLDRGLLEALLREQPGGDRQQPLRQRLPVPRPTHR